LRPMSLRPPCAREPTMDIAATFIAATMTRVHGTAKAGQVTKARFARGGTTVVARVVITTSLVAAALQNGVGTDSMASARRITEAQHVGGLGPTGVRITVCAAGTPTEGSAGDPRIPELMARGW
jgi:hypothetical protein